MPLWVESLIMVICDITENREYMYFVIKIFLDSMAYVKIKCTKIYVQYQ